MSFFKNISDKITDRFSPSGKIDMLEIIACKDKTFKDETNNRFKVMFNPATLNLKFAINRVGVKAEGQKDEQSIFNGYTPTDVSFEIVLDGTGAVKKEAKGNVAGMVKKFLGVVYDYDSGKHEARYLKLVYGEVVLNCVLTALDVNYTLFDKSGKPLRAKLMVTVKSEGDQKLNEIVANKQSSDLTHIRELKQSDRFTLLANDIYDDNFLYVQAAEANGLDSFRNLQPGTQLIFPPAINTAD